ncbi:hypothetical protein F511_32418 [Dorcoceras hygrometricum]|uniref:Uncharacterized protein n=1 Tax=Dorcoceras hygrometricum TaxID=472368 RepID=A0A2Z7BPM0_9LAMI|nr:hypothetical protein F511_32418 [Dorcoceras hygrometricum]
MWQSAQPSRSFPYQLSSMEAGRVSFAYGFFLICIYVGLLKLVHPLIATARIYSADLPAGPSTGISAKFFVLCQ